jgi:hypothetical protein
VATRKDTGDAPEKGTRTLDEKRLRIGVALGMGNTPHNVGELAGITDRTVDHWKKDPEVQWVQQIVAEIHSCSRAAMVQREAISASERIKWVFDRSFAITERAIDRVEALGDEAKHADLMEIHKSITMWAAKFVVSEAPKRLEVDSKSEVTYQHVVSLSEANNMLARREEVFRVRPAIEVPALPAQEPYISKVTAGGNGRDHEAEDDIAAIFEPVRGSG